MQPIMHSRYFDYWDKRNRKGPTSKNVPSVTPPTQLPISKKLSVRFAEEPLTVKHKQPSPVFRPSENAKEHGKSHSASKPHAPPPAIDAPQVPPQRSAGSKCLRRRLTDRRRQRPHPWLCRSPECAHLRIYCGYRIRKAPGSRTRDPGLWRKRPPRVS